MWQKKSARRALAKLSIAGENVEAKRQALVQKIGENVAIRLFVRMQSEGKLVQYLHGVKIGVMVDYEGDDEMGKGVAMHIAFTKPQFMSKAEVAADVVARERAVQEARARESGKPPEIAAKMVEGALGKFLAEITLLGQSFVMNDKQTVEKALAEKKTKLRGYRFLVVGEGIEKKSSDFAAEVMAQAGRGALGPEIEPRTMPSRSTSASSSSCPAKALMGTTSSASTGRRSR
jgi:elongation factor Ts